MSKRSKIVLAIVAFFFIAYIIMIILLLGSGKRGGASPTGTGAVALIRISGVISGEEDGQLGSGGTSPERVINEINQAEEDDYIKAILLRVNSPGGTAGASEEIYSAVKNASKPVIVSVSDMCASGAYWISSGADLIIANPVSSVGSIGVILEVPNLKGLFEKLGIDLQVISQGKYKDIGNPARALTKEERAILQSQVKTIYDIFVKEVADSRNLPIKKVSDLANGLTYPAVDAKKYKLIDELGNFEDALKAAGKLGNVEGKPEVIEFEKPGLFDFFGQVFGSRSNIDIVADKLRNQLILPNKPTQK